MALKPFAAWVGPRRPKIVAVGEAWGAGEEACRQPFVGYSGKELWLMLGEAGADIAPEAHARAAAMFNYDFAWIRHRSEWLEAAGIALTNVFSFRPPDNKLENIALPRADVSPRAGAMPPIVRGRYLPEPILDDLDRLRAELVEAQPNLILALGNTATWALLRSTSIGSIRGAITSAVAPFSGKVLPTYHPAGVLRQWAWRPIVVADFIKAFREAEFPEIRRPSRLVYFNPTLDDCHAFLARMRRQPPPLLSVDVETAIGQIKCISFSPSRRESFVIPFWQDGPPGSYWPTGELELAAWDVVEALCRLDCPKVGQNFLYDLQYITRMGILPTRCEEDTMMFHHSLFPEMQKGLGFLGSIYTNEASWKLMRRPKADTEKRDE